jgi:hypothetical protein
MTYEELLTASENTHLRNQIKIAITLAATYILNGGSPNNANHEIHAARAYQNPDSYISYFIWDVINDATVNAAYPNQTDASVRAVVDAKWPRAWK